jgi:hypothetical protein
LASIDASGKRCAPAIAVHFRSNRLQNPRRARPAVDGPQTTGFRFAPSNDAAPVYFGD